jgi:hypothetical protein|tara:strand:+ start:137 stop:373 length:237 start_codon:yes stop_codon:yes gene_type:complete
MKTMTCRQLGGACDIEFHANSFKEMAHLSREHGREMFNKNDAAHLEAMKKMMDSKSDPAAMQQWMDKKMKEFEALPDY